MRSASIALLALTSASIAADSLDLTVVKHKAKPAHPPVVLVQDGKPVGNLAVMGNPTAATNQAVQNLQLFIRESTGAELPIVRGKITAPAIVVGDCELAQANGLVGKNLPVEGFAVKTAKDHVLIVGHDADIVGAQIRSNGTASGVNDVAERLVGARWYFPGNLGRSVPKAKDLIIEPIHYEDAPVFRKREIWPPVSDPWRGKGTQLTPLHDFLRAGNSWPTLLTVHSPDWSKRKDLTEGRPEVFQQRSDGTRDFSMLCYAHPKTLQTYLEEIDKHIAGKPANIGIVGNAVSVSPADAEIACYAPESRKLWDDNGGQYGSASKIVGKFAADLGRELKKRHPGKTVIYLPYLNYTTAPEGVEFPDNVEVQLCGMPGLAMYKEPTVAKEEQANIDRWVKHTGHKIQNWHYSCWPEDRTKAAYHYPHAVRDFYQANRDKTVGTFINGTTDHWPRQHVTLYCWLKILWNPDFDVDAAITEYVKRMYGAAASPMRELIALQIDGWEKSRFPGGRISAKAVYEIAYPRKTVERMEALLKQARELAASDPTVLKRIDYYAGPFVDFFQESRDYASGAGLKPLLVQKVGENPMIDGKLDDAVWNRATEMPFVLAYDKERKPPKYPTTVRAVWTPEGVTLGFRMTEPTPERLERDIKGRDDSLAWWNDNVELLFDVTGKNEGEFYHFIINANAATFDAKGKDASWNAEHVKSAAFVGKDFWSVEVFVPYKQFPEAVRPTTGVSWHGNFTRHRVADRGLKPKFNSFPDSAREYQRLNTTFAVPSVNLADFAQWKFVE